MWRTTTKGKFLLVDSIWFFLAFELSMYVLHPDEGRVGFLCWFSSSLQIKQGWLINEKGFKACTWVSIGHTLRSFQLRTWAGRESSKTCKRTSAEKWNLEFTFTTFLCCISPACHGSWSVICPKINIILLPDQHSTTYRSHLIRAFSLES